MNKNLLKAALMTAVCLGPAAVSAESGEIQSFVGKTYIGVETYTAEVTAIDHEARMVNLKNERGETRIFHADDDIRNLEQVQVGDVLVVSYAERLAVKVFPVAGGKGRIESTQVSRSSVGQKPYGELTKTVEITGRISAIDKESRMITLEGKHGELITQVDEDVDLSKLNKGDTVRMEYMESVVMSVETPAQVVE